MASLHRLPDRVCRVAGVVAVALGLAAGACGAAVAAEAPRHLVKDPHFGDSLFYFYQARYFTSVTNLMVSQHFERLPHHVEEAELLRGGLFLSYGLHREAGEIFAQLIDKGAPPAIRDRAWFYLAKIRYQRGLLAQAEDAIGRIAGPLPGDLEEERLLLHSNLLMARADYAGAAALLERVKIPAGVGAYLRYNLGVALMKSGKTERGTALLDEVGRMAATTEELRSLRDKANVALGFTALQTDRPENARTYLERVRLTGMLANKALLGFGWAAAALKQPRSALVPWTELSVREPADAAVLEAKLAVPYAFAELGAFGQALDRYKDAIAIFDKENTYLDESIAAIRAGKLLAGLLERNPGEEMGWFWNITELPEMPHGAHLAQVLAQHEFQEAFKNYRDLKFMEGNLRHWQESLAVLRDMLESRRQAFAQRLPVVRAQERSHDIGELERRRDLITGDVAAAETAGDGLALADARERELLERLERVRASLDRLGNEAEATAARERYRRAAGAMTWQLSDQLPARMWDAKKTLKEIDAGLSEARERDAALTRAQQEEPARFDQFGARIGELQQRLIALGPRVGELIVAQQGYIQDLAVAALEDQKQRLAYYGTQARFAVAQIYDRARVAREGGNAGTPQ